MIKSSAAKQRLRNPRKRSYLEGRRVGRLEQGRAFEAYRPRDDEPAKQKPCRVCKRRDDSCHLMHQARMSENATTRPSNGWKGFRLSYHRKLKNNHKVANNNKTTIKITRIEAMIITIPIIIITIIIIVIILTTITTENCRQLNRDSTHGVNRRKSPTIFDKSIQRNSTGWPLSSNEPVQRCWTEPC